MENKIPKVRHVHASTIRSRLLLEVAAEMVAGDQPNRHAQVLLKAQSEGEDWPIRLSASSTVQGVEDVVAGRATTGIANPSAILTLAYRGRGPFKTPQPVRAIATIPAPDHYMFTVTADTGLVHFEDIGARKFPLRIAGRNAPDHCLHMILEDVMVASGFSLAELKSWGGDLRHLLTSRGSRLDPVRRGEANAIFDEAVHNWIDDVIEAGMTILTFSESTIARLQAMGYRPGILSQDTYPRLPRDMVTLDFSGWTLYVHADAPDWLVTQFCAGMEARKHLIPWQEEGALPVERMCRDAADTPLDVPLHPAAERFWRERGYLD